MHFAPNFGKLKIVRRRMVRGTVKSATEIWNYEDDNVRSSLFVLYFMRTRLHLTNIYQPSQIECAQGAYKVKLKWSGNECTLLQDAALPNNPNPGLNHAIDGKGVVGGGTFQWYFPSESQNTPFWSFQQQGDVFVCTSMTDMSKTTWQISKSDDDNTKVQLIAGGEDHPKTNGGSLWEISGSTPLSFAFFVIMFTRTQSILDNLIQRRKRNYHRCGAFTLNAANKPRLCTRCSQSSSCVCCSSPHASIEARLCKNCAIRKVPFIIIQ